jgi:hypothetical protein
MMHLVQQQGAIWKLPAEAVACSSLRLNSNYQLHLDVLTSKVSNLDPPIQPLGITDLAMSLFVKFRFLSNEIRNFYI